MYLQKCEEYTGGQLIGAPANGELYIQRYCFFYDHWYQTKHPIHYKICTGNKIHADWLKNQIIGCLKVLTDCGFKVRMIISDNHPCNTSAYHKILNHFNTPYDIYSYIPYSYISCMSRKKNYLCFDTAHLIKRNNLLNN